MSIRRRSGLLVLVLFGTGYTALRADSGLLGSTLGWQYYAGGGALPASVTGSVTGGSFIDNDGIGGELIVPTNEDGALPVFDIDAYDSTITFDYSVDTAAGPWSGSPLSLAPTIYDGIAIDLLSAGAFTSVSVDPATTMAGFDADNISFTGDQIEINWAGLNFDTSTVVTLDVDFSAPSVPEPATYSLMALSLLSGFVALRSKLKVR